MGTPLPPIDELTDAAVTEDEAKTWLDEARAALVERGDPFGRYGNRMNVNLALSVGSNALTIAAKQRDGENASAEYPLVVAFRDPTLANFGFNERMVTGALSTVISAGSTAGHSSGVASYLYIYAIEVGSSWELAWSTKYFGDQVIVSTTAEGGGGAADSATTMYSTTARSNVVAVLLGRWKSTQSTAGQWAATSGEKALAPFGDLQTPAGSAADPSLRLGNTGKHGLFEPAEGVIGATGGFVWGSGETTYGMVVKRKTANESVTSSITLQNDDHLTFSIGANEEWEVVFEVSAGSLLGTTGVIFGVTAPSGATIEASLALIGLNRGDAAFTRTTTIGAVLDAYSSMSSNQANARISAWILNGANAGTVALQFAQLISSGTAVTLFKGGRMVAHRIA